MLIPSAAMAAVGTFTSGTATPAVTGTNSATVAGAKGVQGSATATNTNTRYGVSGNASGANGIGVIGTGTKYGVYSHGPFAATGTATIGGNATFSGNVSIAAGKALSCTGCVSGADLSSGAQAIQPLASGASESGTFAASDSYTTGQILYASLVFVQPVPGSLTGDVVTTSDVHCPGAGSAAAGYLCVYVNGFNVASGIATPLGSAPYSGGLAGWNETAANAVSTVSGTFTVTAP